MKSHKIYYLQHSLIMFKEICDVGGIIFFIIIKLIAEFYLFDVFLNNVGRRNDEHSFNETSSFLFSFANPAKVWDAR